MSTIENGGMSLRDFIAALQEQQSAMRDPERTIVCDILANGAVLPPDFAGDRYAVKDT